MPTQPNRPHAIDFGRLVEVVGLVGIVISLVFLGYELKRSNDIAEAQAVAEIYGMTNELGIAMAENPELSRALGLAQSDFERLSPEDLWNLYVIIEHVINTSEVAWKYYDKGIINRDEASYFAEGLCRIINLHPSLVAAWQENEENRIPGFYDYITDECDK